MKKVKASRKTDKGKIVLTSEDREKVRDAKANGIQLEETGINVETLNFNSRKGKKDKVEKTLSKTASAERRFVKASKGIMKNGSDKRAMNEEVKKIVKEKVGNMISEKISVVRSKKKDKKFNDVDDEFSAFGVIQDDLTEDLDDMDLVKMKREVEHETRKISKDAIHQVFAPIIKERGVEISRSRDLKSQGLGFSEISEEKSVVVVPKPKKKEIESSRLYSKEDSLALRENNKRRKIFKKQQKKERQSQRKVDRQLLPEAGEETVEDMFHRYFNYGDKFKMDTLFSHYYINDREDLLPYSDIESGIHLLGAFTLVLKSRDLLGFTSSLNYLHLALCDRTESISPYVVNAILAKICWPKFKRLMGSEEKVLIAEGGVEHPLYKLGEMMENGIDMSGSFLNGHVFSTLKDILICSAALRFFDKDVAIHVYQMLGREHCGKSIVDLLHILLKSVGTMLKISGRIAAGESIESVLSTQDPASALMLKIVKLHDNCGNTYSGLPVEGRMSDFEWNSLYSEAFPMMEKFKQNMNPLSYERTNLDRMMSKISVFKREMVSKAAIEHRMAPLVFTIVSPPGYGKSKIVDFTAAQHSLALKREYSPKYTFHINGTAKHWNGFDAATHCYIHMSEVGCLTKNIVSVKGDVATEAFLSVADSLPFNPPMAELADKKTNWVKAEMVIADSNFSDLNIPILMRSPGACYRRIDEVHIRPKDEFRTKEGQIDVKASLNSDNLYFDKWIFDIYRYKVQSNEKYDKYLVLAGGDIYDYANYIKKRTLDHVANEKSNVEIMNNPRSYEGYTVSMEEKKDLRFEAGEPVCEESNLDFAKTWTTRMGEFLSTLSVQGGQLAFLATLSVMLQSMKLHKKRVGDMLTFVLLVFALFILLLYSGFMSIGIFGTFGFFYVFSYYLSHFLSDKLIDEMCEVTTDQVLMRSESLKNYVKCEKNKHFSLDIAVSKARSKSNTVLKYGAMIGLVGAGSYGLSQFFFRKDESKDGLVPEDSTTFVHPSEYNEKLNAIEEAVNAGESFTRIPSKLVEGWSNIVNHDFDNKHTSGAAQLSQLVLRNTREVIVHSSSRKTMWNTKGFGLCQNVMGINTHSLPVEESFMIEVGNASYALNQNDYTRTIVTKLNRVDVGSDLTLIWVSGISFRDLTPHLVRSKGDLQEMKSVPCVFNGAQVMAVPGGSQELKGLRQGDIVLPNTWKYFYAEHCKGMCGTLLVGQVGRKSFVLAFHAAAYADSSECYGVQFDYDIIKEHIEKGVQMLPLMNENKFVDNVLAQLNKGELTEESGLELPSSKSPTRYLKLQNMTYLGKLPGDVFARGRSNLVENVFSKPEYRLWDKFHEVYNHIPTDVFGKPVMKARNIGGTWVDPYGHFLNKVSLEKAALDKTILRKCIDVYKKRILSALRETLNLEEIRPLNIWTALNGAAHDCFIRRMDMRKAAGFGFNGKKMSHVNILEDFKYEPNDELKKEIVRILNCYDADQNSGFVYNAQLKDEPRLLEKVRLGKTRVFFASSFASLIVSRMFLAPFYSLMIEFWEPFCTAIGIDMHREPQRIVDFLKFPDSIMAGDYSAFDQRIPFDISWASSTLIYEILQECGYSEVALRYVKGILNDGLFPVVCMLKDLFVIPGLQPSGKYATAEDNSMKNIFLMLYAWYSHPDLCEMDFFQYVNPLTYGDDLSAGVHPDVRDVFNDVYYAQFCKDHFKMEYTDPLKGNVVDKFTTLSKFQYLKRNFVWDEELGRFVAPLHMDSILKTLSWRMESDCVSESDQVLAMTTSVLYELWFHSDRQQFDHMRAYLIDVLMKEYGPSLQCYYDELPKYEKLLKSFDTTSHVMEISEEDFPICDDPFFRVRYNSTEEIASQISRHFIDKGRALRGLDISAWWKILLSANTLDLENLKAAMQEELKELSGEVDPTPAQKQRVEDIFETINLIDKILERKRLLIPESGQEIEMKTGMIEPGTVVTHETMQDVGGNEPVQMSSEHPLHSIMSAADVSLGEFLSRPLQIYSAAIALNTDVDIVLNPWDLFTTSQSVRAKLKNFGFIHANMKVRLALAGTPFHKGKLRVSYVPFSGYNTILQRYLGNSLYRTGKLQYLSQQKDSFTLDPKVNTPVEMNLPFFSPAPMARLFTNSSASIGGSYSDLSDMGTLYISTQNQVGSCSSGTPTNVYLYVYAWMEDVKLGTPTATVVTLTAESGDEVFQGPLSGTLNEASKYALMGKTIPVLRPYADAAGKALIGLRDASAALGFSKPVSVHNPALMKNEPFRNGANTTGMETLKRITLDPLQGVAMNVTDSSLEDEMSYEWIQRREGLFVTFSWSPSATPASGPLYSIGVNPANTVPYYVSATRSYMQPTPLAMVARPHAFWRGRIKYRVEIVATDFHRGKMAVVFEPNISQWALLTSQVQLNKQYMCVVDLQETQDFEFCVDMAFVREWCRVFSKNQGNCVNSNITSGYQEFLNGFISFYALNALQSPDSSSVSVNIYVSGDGVEFNRITETNLPTRRLMAESGYESSDVTCFDLNQEVKNDGRSGVRSFGEKPQSFRSFLKRYVTCQKLTYTLVNGSTAYLNTYNIGPVSQPTPTTDATSGAVNWYAYLKQAYLGYRGGFKYRYRQYGISPINISWILVSLIGPSTSAPTVGNSDNTYVFPGTDGTVMFAPSMNPGVEFEVPYYENNLWLFSNSSSPWPGPSAADAYGTRGFYICNLHTPNTTTPTVDDFLEFAIAEDFTFLYFTGCPPYTTDLIV